MKVFWKSVIVSAGIFLLTSPALGQNEADVDSIHRFLDRYAELEDAMDMTTQAQMIAEDRVWIAPGGGRRTNQIQNMRIQQVAFDDLRAAAPEVQIFTDDQDRLIKFYAGGAMAVVSFYRYQTVLLPLDTPQEVSDAWGTSTPSAITLVLEKRGSDWRIVHTHISALGPPAAN